MINTRILVLLHLVLFGCTVPTEYSKSVSVKTDPNGNILEITETEAVLQRGGQGHPLTFQHLKGVIPTNKIGRGPESY